MEMAHLVASWSEDRSTKVGAVIVDDRNNLISIGWNGFPRGVNGSVESRYQRPDKYVWTEHAERNSIYNVASKGDSSNGATMYSTLYPCSDCCRGIIQSGIRKLVTLTPDFKCERWGEQFKVSKVMLEESGVLIELLDNL